MQSQVKGAAALDSNDVALRLRSHETEGVTSSDRFHLRNEAAAEIDRLRAESELWQQRRAEWSGGGPRRGGKDLECEKCGGTLFRLRYGTYVLMGKCVACGKEQEVYSG